MDQFVILTIQQYKEICRKVPNITHETSGSKSERISPSMSAPIIENQQQSALPIENSEEKNMAEEIDNEKNTVENVSGESPSKKTKKSVSGLKKNGVPLYDYLKSKSPAIDWTVNNELLLSGSLVPNSNIVQLINDATNNNGSIKSNEASWRVFRAWLKNNNVPQDLVNSNVTNKIKSPPIENPSHAESMPSVSTLVENYNNGEPPIVDDGEYLSAEDTSPVEDEPIHDTGNNRKRKKISNGALRRSARTRKAPNKYGRWAKGSIKRATIKWLKY